MTQSQERRVGALERLVDDQDQDGDAETICLYWPEDERASRSAAKAQNWKRPLTGADLLPLTWPDGTEASLP